MLWASPNVVTQKNEQKVLYKILLSAEIYVYLNSCLVHESIVATYVA